MNYYVILGIPVDADHESIRHAFRVLARRFHPDAGAGSSAEKFHQIFEAYETLRILRSGPPGDWLSSLRLTASDRREAKLRVIAAKNTA